MVRKYPSLVLLLFVLAGIVLADLSCLRAWSFLVLSLAGFIGGAFCIVHKRSALATVLFGLSLTGFAGFHFSHRYFDVGPHHLSRIVTEKGIHRLYGQVADWPVLKPDRTEIVIELDSLAGKSVRMVEGAILLRVTDTTTALQRGDRVEFRGRIYPLPPAGGVSGFNYHRYLTLKGLSGIVYLPTLLDVRVDRRSRYGFLSFVDDLRLGIVSSLHRNLSPIASALATGFLIGETRDIPADVYRMFRDSGTLHLLAVSGSNVALVIAFFVLLMRPLAFGPNRRAILLLVVIAVFAALSYGDPSVVRASVMATLVILAGLLKRRHDLNNIIALAALVILLVEPAQLYDVGFQLSFVTAWGLIFIVPRLTRLFTWYRLRGWRRWLLFALVISVVAQVCSAPIIAYYFERLPIIAVLANLVIVPLVSVAVIGILVLLVADFIWPLLGMFVGSLINQLLLLVLWCLKALGSERIPVLDLKGLMPEGFSVPLLLWVYMIFVLIIMAVKHRPFRRMAVLLVAIGINAVLGIGAVLASGEDGRWVWLQTVPGGVAAVVSHPGCDEADLILTGLSGRRYAVEERILGQLVADLRLSRLERIFLLSAEYDALDDIVRLARRQKAETIFVASGLEASLTDVLLEDTSAWLRPEIRYLKAGVPGGAGPGYYFDARGLWLKEGNLQLVLTDQVRFGHLLPLPQDTRPTLVVGQKWRPAGADWVRLQELGYEAVLCSKVEQYFDDTVVGYDQNPDKIVPEFVYDLGRSGPLRLSPARVGKGRFGRGAPGFTD